jgi:hypothetical protein
MLLLLGVVAPFISLGWAQQPVSRPQVGGGKVPISVMAGQQPPSAIESLRQRVSDLETEVARLKQAPASNPVVLTPPNERVRSDVKTDDAQLLKEAVTNLWKAIDQIWANLDTLKARR